LLFRAGILDDHVGEYEGVNILVADHNRWSRLCVASVLTTAGFCVEEASNGMTALRMACDVKPHVVIVGPELPEIAAADLVGLLRSDPRTRDAAVVQVAPAETGCDADVAITLPCSPIELFTSVVDALAARHARSTASAPARRVTRPTSEPRVAAVA
jgi:CheY-like chemotaxis protein